MKVSLKSLLSKYKFQIGLTFSLLTMEAILLIFIPYFIGSAIDDLVLNRFSGLYLLGTVLLMILLFSTSRRLYDTRVYSRIYALLGSSLIHSHKKKNISESIIVTRSNLIKEMVDFFEHDLTQAYTSLIGIFGALLVIFYINVYVAALCLVGFLLVYLLYMLSEGKIYNENEVLNKELENRLSVIKGQNRFLIPHFKKLSKSMIRLSDIESYNYVVIQLLIGLVIATSLFIGVKEELSTGDIFALLTYVLNFSFEVLTLPVIFQQFIRLQEITQRINKGIE